MAFRRRRTRTVRRARRGGRRLRGVTAVGYRGVTPTMPAMRAFRGRRIPMVRSGMKRRGRSASRVGMKRRRVLDPGGYTQWNQSRVVKKLGRLTQRKINMIGTEVYDLLWKRTGRLDGGGQLWAGNYNVDSVTAVRPCYLFDLTSGKNNSETASPMMQLVRIFNGVSGGSYAFQVQTGFTSTGGTSGLWQDAATNNSARLQRRAILKWTDIRADIWGAKEHPVEWIFTLCQINERVLPEGGNYNLGISDNNAIVWWDSFMQALCFTPSDRKVNEGLFSNNVRVLDRRSFVLNPTSTTETDADPHVRSVRFFYRLNRKCDFGYEDRTALANELQTSDDPAQKPVFKPQGVNNLRAYVDPKARVFMMVTCKNWRSPPDDADVTTANTASFNFAVYNRWVTN